MHLHLLFSIWDSDGPRWVDECEDPECRGKDFYDPRDHGEEIVALIRSADTPEHTANYHCLLLFRNVIPLAPENWVPRDKFVPAAARAT
jgi:hypothetical protein